MNESKIEPRLRDEMRRVEKGSPGGRIAVLVQISAEEPTAEVTSYEALGKRVRAGVEAIQSRLKQLGFDGELHENVLAGSLETELTGAQIEAVSELADVKRVVLNRVDNVACAGEN